MGSRVLDISANLVRIRSNSLNGGSPPFGKKSNVTIVSEAGDLRTHDKVNLDIFWLKDDSLEESANLPASEVIDQEITDDRNRPLSNSPLSPRI